MKSFYVIFSVKYIINITNNVFFFCFVLFCFFSFEKFLHKDYQFATDLAEMPY